MNVSKKSATAQCQERFDPCSEATGAEQVAAANWELLRRVPDFQETARKWTANRDFRRQHVAQKGTYAANAPARCALDWMLTPTERLELAEFQKAHLLLFRPNLAFSEQTEWNFGPIIIEYDWEAHDGWLSDCVDKIVRIRPVPDWEGRLTLESSWKDSAGKFKQQFRQTTIGGSDSKEIDFQVVGLALAKTGNALLGNKSLSTEQQRALGRYLFSQGQYFREIDKAFKAIAIPRIFMDERKVDEVLAKIKTSLHYLPRTGHDWNTKQSFLGTPDQWKKFLTWEAHGGNAYRAAAEFVDQNDSRLKRQRGKQGEMSLSEVQRDIAGSVRTAVKAIKAWFPRLYPGRNLQPFAKPKNDSN